MQRRQCRVATAAGAIVACALLGSAVVALQPGIGGQAATEAALRNALESGEYARAVELATSWLEGIQVSSGSESLRAMQASDLLVDALTKAGRAADDRTVSLAEDAVRLKEALLGTEHLELALSVHQLGAIRTERGEFGAAVALHERGLSIRARSLAAGDPAIADSLDYLAVPLIRLQRFDDARRHLDRSLGIREVLADRAPRALARTLEVLALLNRYSGKYADSKGPLERAIAIRHDLALDNHPETASLLSLRGDVLYLGGDIQGAKRAWTDALTLVERTLGPEHPAVSPLARRIGAADQTLGNMEQWRRLLQRALQVNETSLASCHPESAGLLNDLATSAAYFGEYAQARHFYQRALTIRERCLGPNHSLTATVIYNQAELAGRAGDYADAERLYESANRVWSATLGPNHPYVARGFDAIADVLASRGQPIRARALYERALAIRRKTLGSEHPDVAWTMSNLARTIADLGDTRLARANVNQAIEIFRHATASGEPDQLARMLSLRGELEMRQGEFASARTTFEEALATRERIFGEAHPLSAQARALVASAQFALGAYQPALDAALGAEQTGRDHLRFTIRYLPERQSLLYAANRPRGLDLALSIVAGHNVENPAPVLDAVIQSRAIVLDELANRAQSATAADPVSSKLREAAATARQRFANLMLRSMLGEEPVARSLLDQARTEKEAAERALAEQSAAERAEQTRSREGLDDIRRMLPPGSALVSFVRYDRTPTSESGGGTGLRAAPASAYIAFVTRADGAAIAVVPLGPSRTIDGLIGDWRSEVLKGAGTAGAQAAIQSYRAAAAALRRRIWDPLARHLDRVDKVFIVPDASISVVAFDALPVANMKYLVETGPTIHYLSAERDLVESSQQSAQGKGLLAVGGASFGTSPAARPTAKAPTRSGCGALQNLHFEPLPGTRLEVAEINAIWKAAAATSVIDSSVLAGGDATESHFKQQAPGRRFLHIATHGFFLGNGCGPAIQGSRSVGGLVARVGRPNAVPADNPLTLSGLAMAGANRHAAAPANEDDGILTAEEVTALNLQGVEWAVLSACDTGLGELKAGEGVLGLRRAFQIAGVHTIIMSLWAVDDDAVRSWMHVLYEGRLQQGVNTADAMHRATLDILRKRRARGASTHPFFWAGFVAAGDWR